MTDLRVWKFPLIPGETPYSMPRGARVIHVDTQPGYHAVMWALVDADNGVEDRRFTIVGTGHPVPSGSYVGTCKDGEFVWHVFDTTSAERSSPEVGSGG